MALRGFHSKSSSSTASSTAATGVANVADMPAAAPATSSVFRSLLVRWKCCATSDPIAPPVRMIGPSAPKGPPVPIEMAAEMGFRIATRGATRLPLMRIDSIASGMPCPRMRSDPYRAMHTDDEAAHHRHRDEPRTQMRRGWRYRRQAEAAEEADVGRERDQIEQQASDDRGCRADGDRNGRDASIRGVVVKSPSSSCPAVPA